MGAVARNTVNEQLLRMSYSDTKNLKQFLRNWGGLEALSYKGDTVATCILVDLQIVTGIDIDVWDKGNEEEFNKLYEKGVLSYYQYMSVAYVLVLGYTTEELGKKLGVSHQFISKCLHKALKKIQRELGDD